MDGNGVESKRVFNFQSGGQIYMKFMVDGGGKYMAILPRIFSGAGVKTLTTHNSWAGSIEVPDKTWLYAHFKVDLNGNYKSTICTQAYDNLGGLIISSYKGMLKNMQGRIRIRFVDNYAGTKAYVVIGEVLVRRDRP